MMHPLRPEGSLDATVAVGFGERKSLAHLRADVSRLAAQLLRTEAETVVLSCRDRYAFTVGLLASWEIGRLVALPPNAQEESLEALVSATAPSVLLHDGERRRGLDVRASFGSPDAPHAALRPIADDRMLVRVHTSGTTAGSRAFDKTAGQLLGEAKVLVDFFGIAETDVFLATVPPQHLYGLLFGVLVPLVAGATIVRESPFHAAEVAAVAERHRATVLVAVPAHLRSLEVIEDGARPRAIRRIVSSGAPLPDETAAMLNARFGWTIDEILGSSETGGIAHRTPPAEGYRALPGVKVSVAEEERLQVDSPFLGSDLPRPFVASDRIELLADGRFRHLGRADDVVKIAGKRLELRTLEEFLRRQRGVEDVAVDAEPIAFPRGTRVRVAVVAPDRTPDDLRRAMLAHFDPVVVPRTILCVPALPRTATGKLPRAALRALFEVPPPVADADAAFDPEDASAERMRIAVPADSPYFEGHFEGDPLLPAVTQLESIVARQARRRFPELGAVRRFRKLKFRKPIRPGAEITLKLERKGTSAVAYEIVDGDELASTGVLEFRSGGEG